MILQRQSAVAHRTRSRRSTACKVRRACLWRPPFGQLVIRADATTQFQGCTTPLPKPIKVVGCGSCGVDYLASILAYPKPDEKLRTEKLEVQGGGNCANALTACARLGLSPVIMTKIGGDGLGDGIISELKADGVDTQFILREPGAPSPFTYIIVDQQGGTRTCIHTPGAALQPSDVDLAYLDSLLDGASLVYFDGRLTEAALKLAKRAKQQRVKILVEAERLRPNLETLLQYADYVVTSAHFPQDWTGQNELADAVLATAQRLPKARLIFTTLGTRGSILLERAPTSVQDQWPQEQLDVILQQLKETLDSFQVLNTGGGPPSCVSKSGIGVRVGAVSSTDSFVQLGYSEHHDEEQAVNQAKDAACRAAALNAEAGNVAGYAMCPGLVGRKADMVAKVTRASIASLPKGAVVDTTGAGDAFIGAVIYGLVTGMDYDSILQLGGVVAATKCTALGARPGLPTRSQLAEFLLAPAENLEAAGV